jgi:hypothetical protein
LSHISILLSRALARNKILHEALILILHKKEAKRFLGSILTNSSSLNNHQLVKLPLMKNEFMGVIFTNHALERLYQRKIAQSDAWYTFKRSDRQLKGKISGSWKFSKSYGPQTIEVIAKQNEQEQWVILSCWSKIMGNDQPIFTKQKESLIWKLTKEIGKKLRKKAKKRKSAVSTE